MPAGPLALLGSGEFTEAMDALDDELLAGRRRRAVFLPTAAAQEGEERLQYWVDLGVGHFTRLGAEVEPVLVLGRADADDPGMAEKVAGAGLVYLSGGDPRFLAETLRGSAVAEAIHAAWSGGAALAGCSAGAMVLAAQVPSIRGPGDHVDGLGYAPGVVVVPHFDRINEWLPGASDRIVSAAPAGMDVLGIDEDSAAVGDGRQWRVYGRGAVVLMHAGRDTRRLEAGERFSTGPG